MTRLLAFLLAVVFLGGPAGAQDAKNFGEPVDVGDGWILGRPATVGLDGAALCDLDKFISQWPGANIHGVVVVRREQLVLERYWSGTDERVDVGPVGVVQFGPEVKHDLRSITKSVTSLLVGIASGEDKFPDLDSPVFDSFPEHADLATPEKRQITFRHLLTMSSGLSWNEGFVPYSDPSNSWRQMRDAVDPLRYVLEQPMAAEPGKIYAYNGGGTMLLGAALAKSTGKRIDDYAREKLFGPLGITDVDWMAPYLGGRLSADAGLRMRPRDLAKLGQLMLNDGAWNGRQVLPEGWAGEVTEARPQRRRPLLLRLSMVAWPHASRRPRIRMGSRRWFRRPAPVHPAGPRTRGGGQRRLLRRTPWLSAEHRSARRLLQAGHAGGDGLTDPRQSDAEDDRSA
jgi:CubicO group peptidase (beta-lactamase class C family)